MAAIHDLLGQITDASLRSRITQEVNKLAKQKKFGLVFEDHVPECTALYGLKIKRGSVVASKDNKINDPFIVRKIEGNIAICQHVASGNAATFNIDELVVVA